LIHFYYVVYERIPALQNTIKVDRNTLIIECSTDCNKSILGLLLQLGLSCLAQRTYLWLRIYCLTFHMVKAIKSSNCCDIKENCFRDESQIRKHILQPKNMGVWMIVTHSFTVCVIFSISIQLLCPCSRTWKQALRMLVKSYVQLECKQLSSMGRIRAIKLISMFILNNVLAPGLVEQWIQVNRRGFRIVFNPYNSLCVFYCSF
jgi:hypothetical protein